MLVVVGGPVLLQRWEKRVAGWRDARRPGVIAAVPSDDPVFTLVEPSPGVGALVVAARDGRATLELVSGPAGVEVHAEIGPCGGRALFALSQPGGWIVSNRLSWLADAAEGGAAVDEAWLAARLMITAPQLATSSPYRAVLTLPFGTTTTLAPDRAARFSVISPPAAQNDVDLAEVFQRVLARHAALSPEHAVLAGGIDSSALVALASSMTKIVPVTLDLRGENQDLPHVEALSRFLGLTPVLVSPREAAADLMADLTVEGAPMLWPTTAHLHAGVRAARDRGIRTVWTGLGGDELFAGSPRGVSALARAGHVREAVALAARLAPASRVRAVLRNVVWASLRARLPSALLYPLAPTPRSTRAWAGAALRLVEAERVARARLLRPEWELSRDEKVARYFTWDHFGVLSFDRHLFEHASGILRLDPYLDPEIVRAACSLPENALIDGLPRAPLRALVRGRLPEEVRVRNNKASFVEACEATFRAVPAARWRELATPTALGDLGLVEPRAFRAEYDVFEADLTGHPEGWIRLWPVLACEAFVRGVARLPRRFPGGVAA